MGGEEGYHGVGVLVAAEWIEKVLDVKRWRKSIMVLRVVTVVVSGGSRGGHRGHVPPLWKKWGHTICLEPMSFLEGVGGWGVTWSLEKVKTNISKLYIIRMKTLLHNIILVRFHLHLPITFKFPIPFQQAIKVSGICQRQAGRATLITTSINLLRARALGKPCHAVPAAAAIWRTPPALNCRQRERELHVKLLLYLPTFVSVSTIL